MMPKNREEKKLPRGKLEREARQKGRQGQHADHAEQGAQCGDGCCQKYRMPCLASLGHRKAVEGGGCGRGRSGYVQQDGGLASAGYCADIDANKGYQGRAGGKSVCQASQERYGHSRAQSGQYAHDEACERRQYQDQEIERLEDRCGRGQHIFQSHV